MCMLYDMVINKISYLEPASSTTFKNCMHFRLHTIVGHKTRITRLRLSI